MFRILLLLLLPICLQAQQPAMMFGDTTRKGIPFSKDPHVVKFNGRYLMYYTLPAHKDKNHPVKGLGIGIAESRDLVRWNKIGEITPATEPEKNGLAAPCATPTWPPAAAGPRSTAWRSRAGRS